MLLPKEGRLECILERKLDRVLLDGDVKGGREEEDVCKERVLEGCTGGLEGGE